MAHPTIHLMTEGITPVCEPQVTEEETIHMNASPDAVTCWACLAEIVS